MSLVVRLFNRLRKNSSWFWVEGSGFRANTPPLVGETGPGPQPRTPNPEPDGILQHPVDVSCVMCHGPHQRGLTPVLRFRHVSVKQTGQIAVVLLIMMVFIVFLVKVTIGIGQVAQVRVETSNAADASALAAASWIASGQNEAAAVSYKMWESIRAVQKLLDQTEQKPFCPGAEGYPDELWQSLVTHPDPKKVQISEKDPLTGLVITEPLEGPLSLLKRWANGAMEAGWNMGRREFLTASLNNMMMRFKSSSGGLLFSRTQTDYSESQVYGDIRTLIAEQQEGLYQGTVPTKVEGLDWNNSRSIDDTWHVTHRPIYDLEDYPKSAPHLKTENTLTTKYYKWCYDSKGNFKYCNCQDMSGDGIFQFSNPDDWLSPDEIMKPNGTVLLQGMRNRVTTGPFVDMSFLTFSDGRAAHLTNPLRISPTTQKKEWDFPIERPVFPDELDPGTCTAEEIRDYVAQGACKGLFQTTAVFTPVGVEGGEGTVTVSVKHTVYVPTNGADERECPPGGGDPYDGGGGVTLHPCYKTVKAKATAEFSAARVDLPQPMRISEAQLTTVE